MKKQLFLFIGIVFITLSTSGQNCTVESLLQKPGQWIESSGGSSGIAAADFAREKKIVAAIHAMIKSKYSPIGVHANFNGGYNRAELNMVCNNYSYSILPLNFYCDGNTVKTESETSTEFSINANLGFGMMGKRMMWLITYDGKLPYAYVTKKEFLKKRKLALFTQMKMAAEGFKDNLKNIEIEKKYIAEEYKNNPVKLSKYMNTTYQANKSKYEKLLADNEKSFKPAFDKIETQLKMSAEELNQQAIVKTDPNDGVSYLFTTGDDPFRKILIKPNPGYFNKKLQRSVPRIFWVYVRWNDQEPIATKFRNDIIKAVDFITLKNMLGKDIVQSVKK